MEDLLGLWNMFVFFGRLGVGEAGIRMECAFACDMANVYFEFTGKKANFPFHCEICNSEHFLNCLFLE